MVCEGCGEFITDPKHCPHCAAWDWENRECDHKTRHDEWRAWMILGSSVALVAAAASSAACFMPPT